jgi:hypothetical protein
MHPLQIKLAAARRRVRRLLFIYGTSRALAVVLPVLVVLGGIDYLLRFEDHGVRMIWSLAAAALLVWAIARYLAPAVRQRLSDLVVAQRIETHFAGLGEQLSSAIEFLGEDADDPLAGSAALRRAAVAQAQARTGSLDWSMAINRRPAVRAAAVAGGIALVVAAICMFRPSDASLAVERLVNPLGSAIWPPVNDLAFTHRIDRLAAGQTFETELIDRNRQMPDEVRIEYRWTSPSGREQIDREKMQPVGDLMIARRDKVSTSFDYRAEGGDDHRMPWLHVEVVEPPRIASLEIKLHPPDYTGWPVQAAERRIVALRGTVVTVQATTSKPLASAVLHQQNEPDVVAQIAADGRGFTIPDSRASLRDDDAAERRATLVVDKSGPYWFELRDRDGMTGGLDDRWEIQAIADQPPSVSLQQPSGNLLVTGGAIVPVTITAKDDLAIHTVDLVYTRSDHTEVGETTLRLFAGPDRAPASRPITEAMSSAGPAKTIDYSWDLGPLKLAPGTHVLLTATAADYHPQVGMSSPRRLTIITPQELEDHFAERELLVFNELSRILKMQQAARLETTNLESAWDRAGRFEKQDVDRLRGDELNQRQVRRSLTSPSEGARAQIIGLLAELTSNRIEHSDLHQRMQGFADEIARLDREDLAVSERDLTAAIKGAEDLRSAPSITVRQALATAGHSQDAVAVALERMLGNMAEWNSVREISRELADIRRLQAALEKDTKDIGAQTVAKDSQELSAAEQSELRRIATQQLDLGRQFERVAQRMSQVAEQLKPADPSSAASIADAARAAQQLGLSGLMRDAGDNVESNQIGKALPKQASARRGLDEMLDILANRREQELARLVQKLRESERQLADLRQQHDGLRKRVKQAAEQPDHAQGRKELERLSREERPLQDEADRLTRQLQRLQADKAAGSLSRAGDQIGHAGKSAAAGDGGQADKHATSATSDLDEAQQQLAEARRKAEIDLATQQLARLDDSLKGFVDRQQHASDETVRLDKLRTAQGQLSRTQLQTLRSLARDQQALSDDTNRLAEQLAGAETFQFVLHSAAEEMVRTAARLGERDTAVATQVLEQDVLSRLKQLVEAIKRDETAGQSASPPANPPAGQQSSDNIRAVAELKLIRLMQEDLNRRTRRLSEAVGEQPPTDEQQADFSRLAKEQGRLAELVLGLVGEH